MAVRKKSATSGRTPSARGARAASSFARVARASVPLVGRVAERQRLASAVARDVLPPVVLFTGAPGVGKARLAGWLAQAVLCPAPTDGTPCDRCQSCRLARGLAHPDLHWYTPHASVGGGSLEQQVAAVDAARGEHLEALRADALHPGADAGTTYYLATVQAMRRAAAHAPTMGARKVFVLTDADRLLAHLDATGEAANALLKLLEEPPRGTTFLLTASLPHLLPDTIRSRATLFPLQVLADTEIAELLVATDPALALDDTRLAAMVAQARGSIRHLREQEQDAVREHQAQALGFLTLALAGDDRARFAAVKAQGFGDARGGFSDLLSSLEGLCVDAAVLAAGASSDDVRGVAPAVAALHASHGGARWPAVEAWCRAIRAIGTAFESAQGNANPQLVLHGVLVTLRRVLGPAA